MNHSGPSGPACLHPCKVRALASAEGGPSSVIRPSQVWCQQSAQSAFQHTFRRPVQLHIDTHVSGDMGVVWEPLPSPTLTWSTQPCVFCDTARQSQAQQQIVDRSSPTKKSQPHTHHHLLV